MELAQEANLPAGKAKEIIRNRLFKDAVDADWARSLKVDPEYIPSLMIGSSLIANPQEYRLLEDFMMVNGIHKRAH